MLQNMSDVLSAIEERLEQPTAKGLATAVSRTIHDGDLAPGAKLPPIREVARQLALSPTTVSAGWALLARAGTIRTEGRRGTTVIDSSRAGAGRYRRVLEHQAPLSLDLSTGVPDATLLPGLTRALAAVRTAGTPGSYLDEPVLPELHRVLLDEWPTREARLTVVDGAMEALDLVSRTCLRLGDRVVVEHPCFPPLLDLLEAVGVEVVGVPLDEGGPEPTAFAAALAASPRAVYLQPRAQNPTGVTMTSARARELAGLVEGSDTLVVEDDSADATSTSAPLSLGAWLPDQTVHVRSFSKSHGPDLRLAAMSGPPEVMGAVIARRQLGQGWSSRLLQRILLSLLTDERSVAEVAAARDEYARRRQAVVNALATRGVAVGGSEGLNIWVPVHDEAAALVRLASQGIGVSPGAPFAVLPEEQGHVRVTVGLVRDGHDELAEAIATAARTQAWGVRAR
jgi:DNA-binding transcriptional MocR family regulator